jgi:hypothetical protein
MNKLFYSSIALSFLLLVTCSEDEPIQANNYIDPKLIGEWYLIDPTPQVYPQPEYSFRGFQINSKKQMIQLGIETTTGKVSFIESPIIDSIIYAYKGKMLLRRFWWFGYTDTLNYKIEGDELTLIDDYYTEVYQKTNLSTQLFDPIVSDLSMKMDSFLVSNFKVFRYPSAYISKKDPSSIYLFANISFSSRINSVMISVEINDFNGIGEYVIPYEKGKLITINGDVLNTYLSDSTITNTISINQFDEVNKICSGEFSYIVYNSWNSKIELRDGTFIIPIYE